MGLATVYGIVKQSNGFIWVKSELEKGSIFTIIIPRTMERTDKPLLTNDSQDFMGNGELILLVDDDVNIRRLAKNMLQNLGYQVTAAASGEEALMFVRQGKLKPDL